MQTIHQQTAAQRMAQWRATGGALDAAQRQESGRDDGLAAYTPTVANPGCSGGPDDGLQANSWTRFTCADDGLAAAPRTLHHGCADDGLSAGRMTSTCADDGLTAMAFTTPGSAWCYQGDDGLMAAYTMMAIPGCPHLADDGLRAQEFTTPGSPTCFQGDDGLEAAGPSFRGCPYAPPAADDGLTAGGWTRFTCADDGLTAGGFSISFCPVMGPEQAPAR